MAHEIKMLKKKNQYYFKQMAKIVMIGTNKLFY